MSLIEALLEVPDWVAQAPCAGLPLDWFFCEKEYGQEHKLLGLEVCRGCEVRQKCLDWAMETRSDVGIFGGMTSKQRLKARSLARA